MARHLAHTQNKQGSSQLATILSNAHFRKPCEDLRVIARQVGLLCCDRQYVIVGRVVTPETDDGDTSIGNLDGSPRGYDERVNCRLTVLNMSR